ncbi:MAG: DUF3592 domain-containing protein [Anaerolineales bacterium]|jgi:hypothetical protein|nr:DUF3592 domain-containing protein [Anaerolineales bacterium]
MNTLLIFIGLFLLGLGVYAFFRQRTRLAEGTVAIGIVTDLIPVRADGEFVVTRGEEGMKIEKKYLYRPEIRFKTHAGRTIDFIAPVATRPSRYAIGDEVEVLYNPENPNDVQINSFLHLWFATLMLVGFGLFVAGMGVLGRILQGG